MHIRSSVKAIIIKDNHLLTMKAKDDNGYYYLLPGGGQNHGETMIDALKRECLEEVGCNVAVGRVLMMREYIGKHHEFAAHDGDAHQVEVMFECSIINNEVPQLGHTPDNNQIGIAWLDINAVEDYRLYPLQLRSIIVNKKHDETIYYGDVN